MSLPETGLCASQRGTMYASAALLRPGIAVGAYPQREDIRDSWLDRTAAGATGFLRQHLHRSSRGHS